ncbi:MAG: hypothetical protein WD045_03000, partial [Pirellulaceae bacterium]
RAVGPMLVGATWLWKTRAIGIEPGQSNGDGFRYFATKPRESVTEHGQSKRPDFFISKGFFHTPDRR